MRRSSAVVCLLTLVAMTLPAIPAMAAHTASAAIGYSGAYYPVIGGGAILTLTVNNSVSSAHAISKVVLDFESSGFKAVFADGRGWNASNTSTTCTYEAPTAGSRISPGGSKVFAAKVTLPWTIGAYDFKATTYDAAGGTWTGRTTPTVRVAYSSSGNADAVDMFHASASPAANKLLALGADAKYSGAILRAGTVPGSALADHSVTDAKIQGMWRFVDLPILSAILDNAVLSSNWTAVDITGPPNYGMMQLNVAMPADWDPSAAPPLIEWIWFADDAPANRGMSLKWYFDYMTRRTGQRVGNSWYQHQLEVATDAVNADVLQSVSVNLEDAGYAPLGYGDIVCIELWRSAPTGGPELPTAAHVIAMRLWYPAKR